MPIPIAKDQTQFNVPTAQGGPDNAGRMVDMNVGLPEAGENLFKATEGAATLLAKMRVESDMAKASNDYLAYKKGMNDLLYSPELDENGEPIGFIYKTGEQAFNSLKDYDAKSSALYQEFTKKLGQYLPVATENAFKSANEFNEGFRNMMMKHATQENEKFKEESLNNYMADTIATVDSGMLAYNDNAIAFFDSKSTEMDHRIMQYYIAKGFPQKGRELYQKKNAELLEATLQQVALNHSNEPDMFGGYNDGEALLNHIKEMNQKKGVEAIPTKKINDLGKKFALRQFENAFISKGFEYNTFKKRLRESVWLDRLDKNKYEVEYDTRYAKLKEKGMTEQIDQINGFLFQVKNGVYTEIDKDGKEMLKDYSADSFKYLPEFFAQLSNPNTKIQKIKDKNGNIEYEISYSNKNYQKKIEEICAKDKSTKDLLDFFMRQFGSGHWTVPSAIEASKIAKTAADYYPGSDSSRSIDDARFGIEQRENAKRFANASAQITSRVTADSDGKGNVKINKVLNASDADMLQQNMVDMSRAYKMGGANGLSDQDYANLMAQNKISSREFDLNKLSYKDRITASWPILGNFWDIPDAWRTVKEAWKNAEVYSKTTGKGTTLGTFLTDRLPTGSILSSREKTVNAQSETDLSRRTNMETLNEEIEGRAEWERGLALWGNYQNQSRVIKHTIIQDLNQLVNNGRLFFKDAENSSKFTVFEGTLDKGDINEIQLGFYTYIRDKNGWLEPDKTPRYMQQIDENPELYVAEFHKYFANWLLDNKPNSLRTSDDGVKLSPVAPSDITDSALAVKDFHGVSYPISIVPVQEHREVTVDRQYYEGGTDTLLPRSKDFPVIRGPQTIQVPVPIDDALNQIASLSMTDKELLEKENKEALKKQKMFEENMEVSVPGIKRRTK